MPVADHIPGFCRDCLNEVGPRPSRCPSCGSPRLIRHGELNNLTLAHIDCDAFYASVEKRDNPELADKPVIVGGGKRGVVSTCCYIARIHGVRSAMPMFKALEACPDAVVIKPDMEKYVRVGRQIRQMMQDLTPLVEPISIDEAFLEFKGTELIHHHEPPARLLARFAQRVEREIGVTVSVGLSYCKFLAKVASDIKKPRGYSVIGSEEAKSFLAPQLVTLIWGVGRAFAEKLAQDGIKTIGQLQEMDEATLMRAYGTRGQLLFNLARGIDRRTVHADGEAKSVSAETTFFDDISSHEELSAHLRALSEKVARRLKKNTLAGQTVVLKLKTHDFKTRTRNHSLESPTQLADRIFRTGLSLLEKETGTTRFRLIGIGVTGLSSPELADPADLIDQQAGRRAKAETAIDKLRDKFGVKSVQTGYTFRSAPLPERVSTRGENDDDDSNS